jgi:hypothetical protein
MQLGEAGWRVHDVAPPPNKTEYQQRKVALFSVGNWRHFQLAAFSTGGDSSRLSGGRLEEFLRIGHDGRRELLLPSAGWD